jgi:triacylglycerol lipase
VTRVRRAVLALALAATTVVGVLVAQPFASSAAASPFPNGKNPIVFVHGFFETGSIWETLKASLKQDGYTDDQLIAIDYNTTNQSNVDTATEIGTIVTDVLARTGAAKVDIVSHSMGGLNSRYCVKFAACAGKTDHWISLAGANKGTYIAALCALLMPTCGEMVPGSAVLTKLNASPALPAGTKYATLWSPNDGIIIPATNTVLEGATNVQLPGSINHFNIFTDAGVATKIKELLNS